MAVVHIPAPLRALTRGESRVEASGRTLAEVIDSMEAAYPGIRARLVDGDRIRPSVAFFVDNVQAASGLSTRVDESSEVYIAPAISGGAR